MKSLCNNLCKVEIPAGISAESSDERHPQATSDSCPHGGGGEGGMRVRGGLNHKCISSHDKAKA